MVELFRISKGYSTPFTSYSKVKGLDSSNNNRNIVRRDMDCGW